MGKTGKNTIQKEDLITFSKFKITSADTDMEARIRVGALVNLLIQSASLSADSLGFGYEGLKEHNLFWVLSRLSIEIMRPVAWNETIEIETWPKDINGLLYIRDFLVRDERKEIIGKAASAWLALDSNTKRPKRKESFNSEIFVYLKDKHALAESPEKLPEIFDGDEFSVSSKYFDLDLNKHVTSSRYFDWMMDTFSPDFHKNCYPERISINYIKEILPGSQLNILRKVDNKAFFFTGVNSCTGKSSFRGKIEF